MTPAEISDLIDRVNLADEISRTSRAITASRAAIIARNGISPCRIGARLVAITGCSYHAAARDVSDAVGHYVSPSGVRDAYNKIYGGLR